MPDQWYRRIDQRDEGRRRLSRLTRWTAAAGVALSSIFGVALAQHDRAAAAPTDPTQDQITNETGDDGGAPPTTPSSGRGKVIQPPAQPPAPAHTRGHVNSGGS
ncbi:MAG TPA: hypothetical protein VH561_20740 [Micromonosporaceae bacterium]|jgi:hypothetical protein